MFVHVCMCGDIIYLHYPFYTCICACAFVCVRVFVRECVSCKYT